MVESMRSLLSSISVHHQSFFLIFTLLNVIRASLLKVISRVPLHGPLDRSSWKHSLSFLNPREVKRDGVARCGKEKT